MASNKIIERYVRKIEQDRNRIVLPKEVYNYIKTDSDNKVVITLYENKIVITGKNNNNG